MSEKMHVCVRPCKTRASGVRPVADNDSSSADRFPEPETSTHTFVAANIALKLSEIRVGGGLGEFSTTKNGVAASWIAGLAPGNSDAT